MYDPDPGKTKAVRKMVRLIIEKQGGEGITVKKDIVADYKRGQVEYKKECVAEWDKDTKTMKLSGSLAQHREEYDKMMEPKPKQ